MRTIVATVWHLNSHGGADKNCYTNRKVVGHFFPTCLFAQANAHIHFISQNKERKNKYFLMLFASENCVMPGSDVGQKLKKKIYIPPINKIV